METIILCIHGLRNKPPRYLLGQWWKQAIIEGFESINLPVPTFSVEMVYWAHYMHARSQNPTVTNTEHPQYLWEPYVRGSCYGPRERQKLHKRISSLVVLNISIGLILLSVFSCCMVMLYHIRRQISKEGVSPEESRLEPDAGDRTENASHSWRRELYNG